MSVILTDSRGAPLPVQRRATGAGIAIANQSPVRVGVTPLNRRENTHLTGQAWRNVVHKVTAYEANVPYVDGALVRMADYRGAVTPYPNTLDLAWNEEITPWLERTFYNTVDFDASGKYSFEEFQKQMWRYRDSDGDVLVVETTDPDSEEPDRPVWRIVPALGVDSPGMGNLGNWIDGVFVGTHHKAQAYHVLAEESAVGWRVPLNRTGYIVDRASAFHFSNWRKVGRARGTTVFFSSGDTVVDLAMLDSSLHRIFNLAAKLAITFETDAGSGQPARKLLEGAAVDDTVPSPSAVDDDGNAIDVQRFKELFMGDGPVVTELEPGQKANLHGQERDLPDVSAVRSSDLERIALAYAVPVQVLFCIYSGAFNITGPGFRVALTSAVRWREGQLRKIEPWVKRAYASHIAWGLRTRQIPFPKKDFRPFECNTRWEKVIGIDEGRDIKMDLIRLQLGATDEAEIAHEYGRNVDDVIRTRAEVINKICAQFGWTPAPEMWAPGWKSGPSVNIGTAA